MQSIRILIATVTIVVSLISLVQADTSWITKKDKSKKVEEVEKISSTEWIKKKKKKIKENKKKFIEKKKESKSWIKKKSKKEKKEEKKILQKYLEIAELPKANFYFTGKSSNGQIIYGYVNADKKSDLLDLNGNSYFSLSNGYAYLDDGKTTCTVNSELGSLFGNLAGKVVVECINKLKFNGNFVQRSADHGRGSGETNDGHEIDFKFTQSIEKNLAFYIRYIKQEYRLAQLPGKVEKDSDIITVKPNGKYYALLIGNSDYSKEGKWRDLASPKNDVTKISKLLENKYKFEEVITVVDATRNDFFNKLNELKNLVTDNDYVLIYYSGHGQDKGSERYWIPVNASKDDRRDWINIDNVTVYFETDSEGTQPDIPSTHLALLVDSCWFKVKGSSNIKNKEMALQKLLNSRAAIVMASGQDEFVDEPGKGNSDFASVIIKELENTSTPIRLHDIFRQVDIDLGPLDQTPIYRTMRKWNHKNGDFIFIPKS